MASNINPTNIDGAYPVAGQDNNSQGFRDNFTNTKTNFQAAATEITDLQTKAILKSALSGTNLDNNMANGTIYAVNLNDVSTTRIAVTTTAGAVSINYASGQYQTISTTNSITLGFINFPAAGFYGSVRLAINITDPSYTVTLPAAVTQGLVGLEGYSAGTIRFATGGIYVFDFSTSDGGSTITIEDLSRPGASFASSAPAAGGAVGVGIKMSSTPNLGVFFGSGAPTLTAARGSLYLRTDGSGANNRMYVNTNGLTTWTSVTTAG